jgi:membrane protein YdbS with pleckstrin-like domain
MTAFVWLAVSYTLIPVALAAVALDPLTAFFWPKWNAGPALTVIPITVEVAIVGILLYRQWRRAVADDEDVY